MATWQVRMTKKVRSPERMPGNIKLEATESGFDAMLNSFDTMLNILLNILDFVFV
jgi:hypothetical protein